MITVIGVLADWLGAASQTITIPANHPGRNFDVKRVFESAPSTEYRSIQAATIPVDIDHDQPIGDVKYLELHGRRLYGVCEIDSSTLGDGPWYFSPSIRHRDWKDIELRGLAVTKKPASVGLGPIDAWPGTLADARGRVVYQDGYIGQIVKRAYEYDRQRKRGEPLQVHDTTPKRRPSHTTAHDLTPRYMGALEYRSAQSVDVDARRRIIDVLAAPYGVDALVNIRGRTVAESFSNTAFIGKQPTRIVANRDHDSTRLFGKITRLEPFNKQGLVATIQASDTALGRETVELARDGILDASVGFKIPTIDGEVWDGRHRRRVTKAELHEIAMTPTPAYAGTRVLDVRDTA